MVKSFTSKIYTNEMSNQGSYRAIIENSMTQSPALKILLM